MSRLRRSKMSNMAKFCTNCGGSLNKELSKKEASSFLTGAISDARNAFLVVEKLETSLNKLTKNTDISRFDTQYYRSLIDQAHHNLFKIYSDLQDELKRGT